MNKQGPEKSATADFSGLIFYMRENSFRHCDKKRSLKKCYSFILTIAFLQEKRMMLAESLCLV